MVAGAGQEGRWWLQAALATGTADRIAAVGALEAVYRAAALPPPGLVIWCSSPLEGALAACFLDHVLGCLTLGGLRWDLRDEPMSRAHEAVLRVRPGISGTSLLQGIDGEDAREIIAVEQVRRVVHDSVIEDAADGCGEYVKPMLWARVGNHLRDRIAGHRSSAMRYRFLRDLGRRPRLASTGCFGEFADRCGYGQHDAALLSRYVRLDRRDPAVAGLAPLLELTRTCGWWFPFKDACVLTDRPVRVERDAPGRPHSASGRTVHYADGSGPYAWHGVRVPRRVIEAPDSLGPEEILGERNVEVRRAMVERVGVERLMVSGGARRIDAVRGSELLRFDLPGDEPVTAVKVSCPSTGRAYFLRVPPEITTCQEAVAWTFWLSGREYLPVVET